MIFGMAIFAISCAEPEEPTPANQLVGSWDVAEFFVNGQANGSGVLQRFFLERDDSFILEDSNGIVFVGTWSSTEDTLTLTADDGTIFSYAIVFLSFTRLQILQTINNPTIGTIDIRYLMNKNRSNAF